MSVSVSAITAEHFLKGVFDVFDAMTGKPFSLKIEGDALSGEGDFLASALSRRPLVLRCRSKSGGAIGVLLAIEDAARLAALVEGKEDGAAADDQAVLAVMREVAEPCLGAGVTHVMEKAGRNPEQPEDVQTAMMTPDQAADLTVFFVNPVKALVFRYSADALEGEGYLLITEELERLIPAEVAKRAPDTPKPELSNAEMNDILSGFGSPPDAPGAPRAAQTPSNIELVLDIRLMATARLGRVEMPIGDILALGPGSIIDVGRLVDEPVELLVNNKLIARGDVVVVDEKFGLRITEIISPKERIESLH